LPTLPLPAVLEIADPPRKNLEREPNPQHGQTNKPAHYGVMKMKRRWKIVEIDFQIKLRLKTAKAKKQSRRRKKVKKNQRWKRVWMLRL